MEFGVTQEHVAYFSMEVGLEPGIPTYSGGLGVLAGDTLRAAADLRVPMVGITLVHRKGYLRQYLDEQGHQAEGPCEWSPEALLEPMAPRVSVAIEGRAVRVRAWRYLVRGVSGHVVPVYLLDTALPENTPYDQTLTDHLYGGDQRYRLCQEVVLGIGGVTMLRALGYHRVRGFHMNEGHSALLTLALLEEWTAGRGIASATPEDREAVRRMCIFTTHTPVPAGHDRFPVDMVYAVLGEERASALLAVEHSPNGVLNMTHVGLGLSRFINGVAKRHGAVSKSMFPNYPITSITNGVHALSWVSPPFRRLYDRYIPEWRRDNLYLRYAIDIPLEEVRQAHHEAKRALITEVKRRTGVQLDPGAFTLGFARRATAYKRGDLLFTDLERLRGMAHTVGPLQVVYSGKAHPRDEGGKAIIRRIFQAAEELRGDVCVVYLPDYDMGVAAAMCAGVDVWLNTPQKPQEASGTSGMKAALNGVPSLSVLDGWWVEGCVEGVTGWAIEDGEEVSEPAREVASLYEKLERTILPTYYHQPDAFASVMRWAIAINGSFFNAQRMMGQYVENAYAYTYRLQVP